jgi:DNA (cytosine-5)-methyltransferase 1
MMNHTELPPPQEAGGSRAAIFSFFSGAGFLDLGFEDSGGFDVRFVNEFNRDFLACYAYSRKQMGRHAALHAYSDSDISEFLEGTPQAYLSTAVAEAKSQYPLVGFIGGPPCPDFSVAGKNAGQYGENGRLSQVYFDLVCEHLPHFFVFENVKGLYRTKKHREFFEDMKTQLHRAGYVLGERLVNAIEFGVPQERERILLIGFHHTALGLKKPRTQKPLNVDWNIGRKYDATEVKNLPWPQTEPFAEGKPRKAPEGIAEELTVTHWFRRNRVAAHPNAQHHFLPRAGLAKFLTIAEGDDSRKSYKRLHRWRYAPTMAFGNNEVHLHPWLPRRLSVAETLALQSLPPEYVLPPFVPLSSLFKTVGNGVPYLMARAIADMVIDVMNTCPVMQGK